MRIQVRVITRASLEKVEKLNEGQYKAWIMKVPIKGEANEALIKLLASHFDVPKYSIEIVGGKTSKDKMIDIDFN